MMVTSLTACQSDSASTSGSTTYTGSAEGYHGVVKVEVTVNGDTIEVVNVVEHSETEGVGTVAIDEIPGWIVENQSLAADTVSGATLTSNAILSAVEQACSEAGLDVEALKNKEVAKETSDEVIQMETDALIIGSGAAGLTAAVSAKEQGIENVMVIEKMPFIGGASAMAHGVWAAGAKAQIDAGVTNDSADILYDDLMVLSQGESNPMLTRMFADNSGRALDWLMDNYGMGVDGPSAFEGASVERNFIFDGSGAKLIEVLNENALEMGVTVQCDTEGKELMIEDGKVVGAIAQGSDDTTYEIKADYVLLATGGYGNNPEMLDHAEGTVYYGPAGLTGDGQKMAEAVGAKLVNMGGIAMKPVNLEVEEGVAKNASAARLGFETIPAILVADDGERIANELAGEAEMRDAWIAHETESLFMLMDEAVYEAFVQNGLDTEFFSEEELEGWKTTEVRDMPILAEGATLDEACAQMNLDSEVVRQTIETYNTNAENGEDEFGREVVGTLSLDGEYHILRVTGRFATTTGGVEINENLQVLDTEGNPIEGLYAAGEVIGNATGECNVSYLTWGIITGQIFGEVIGETTAES